MTHLLQVAVGLVLATLGRHKPGCQLVQIDGTFPDLVLRTRQPILQFDDGD